MRRYVHETETALPPDTLFRAIAAIDRWPDWDAELEAVAIDEPVRAGARFSLKPKGGPKVRMRIEIAEAPNQFVDVALLPFARMRTSHSFTAAGKGAIVRVVIEVWGPLAFLWDRVVARKQADGAEAQTRRFLAFAQSQS